MRLAPMTARGGLDDLPTLVVGGQSGRAEVRLHSREIGRACRVPDGLVRYFSGLGEAGGGEYDASGEMARDH
jgi:hypothetical protein